MVVVSHVPYPCLLLLSRRSESDALPLHYLSLIAWIDPSLLPLLMAMPLPLLLFMGPALSHGGCCCRGFLLGWWGRAQAPRGERIV